MLKRLNKTVLVCVVIVVIGCVSILPTMALETPNWAISKTNIVVAETVLIAGSNLPHGTTKSVPIHVRINGVRVNDSYGTVINHEPGGECNKDAVNVSIELFYDLAGKKPVFDHAGVYLIDVFVGSTNRPCYSCSIAVREANVDERGALQLFTNLESTVVLLTKNNCQKGMDNLRLLADKYPETIWAGMASATIGFVLYEDRIKSPIRSKKDILERDARIAELSHYFERAANAQLGAFSIHSKLHLGRCLCLKGEYDKAYKLFEEVAGARLPHVSKDARMLQKEIKTRITEDPVPATR